jgi:hypothetical protein
MTVRMRARKAYYLALGVTITLLCQALLGLGQGASSLGAIFYQVSMLDIVGTPPHACACLQRNVCQEAKGMHRETFGWLREQETPRAMQVLVRTQTGMESEHGWQEEHNRTTQGSINVAA